MFPCCWTAREAPENYTGMNKGLSVLRWLTVVLVLVLAVWAVWSWRRSGGIEVQVGVDPRIELTPQEISRIERIGQWEFLSVQSEVVVDTLRKGFFSDDRLVIVYSGTPRIGIDMRRVAEGWAVSRGDTVSLRLPEVHLLDENFMDEARMKVFYESGTWSNAARHDLYERARRKMRSKSLVRSNLRRAEANARNQFSALFHALGFSTVEITFSSTAKE